MNIDYLKNEILPLREQEIKEGKNECTRQPIYVVLDLQENIVSGHSDFSPSTNYKNLPFEFGYIDLGIDGEIRTFEKKKKGMILPEKVTRFYTDHITAFFLTSKGANDYLEYQKHNLKNAYVFVFYSGYGNREMDKLLSPKTICFDCGKKDLKKVEEKVVTARLAVCDICKKQKLTTNTRHYE